MDKLTFKTSIKCTGCLASVTPFLNQLAGENQWQVDLQSSDKILTVSLAESISAESVIETVREAGYQAVPLS